MSSTTLTIDQLRLSPYNVRKHRPDAEATEWMESSILAKGLLEPLLAHPMQEDKALYGVFAGGRRYRSIRKLVDAGKLPPDWPILVILHDLSDVELVEMSLDENIGRRDLRPYEIYAAVVSEHKLGRSAAQIAQRHGQELIWVNRALRLGALAAPVFEAFAAGQVSLEQAQALGATASHELQLSAFQALWAGPEHARTPAAIRAWLRVDDREAGKLLRFIGRGAYLEAGGAIEPDLFADGNDESSRLTDEPLLRRMADEKVGALRADARERTGRLDLRFLPAPPRNPEYGGTDSMLYISPGGENGNELPEGDVAGVITILDSGEVEIGFWWASRKALQASTKPARVSMPARASSPGLAAGAALRPEEGYGERQKADAAIKEEAGLTQDGVQTLRSVRRSILRAALVQEARHGRAVGRDYLIWAQLRMQLSKASKYGYAERASDAIDELQCQSFLTEPDLAAAFLDFRAAPQALRDLAAAVIAGIALERSLDADGYRVPAHDALAVEARTTTVQALRGWWQPSAAFLDLLPTAERRAIVDPFVDAKTYASWAKYKSAELTPLVLRVVQGTAPVIRTMTLKLAAAQWIHPLLRFRTDAGVRATEQLEAAE